MQQHNHGPLAAGVLVFDGPRGQLNLHDAFLSLQRGTRGGAIRARMILQVSAQEGQPGVDGLLVPVDEGCIAASRLSATRSMGYL
jgi:hypothetical protein